MLRMSKALVTFKQLAGRETLQGAPAKDEILI